MVGSLSSLPTGPGTGANTANSATAGTAEAQQFTATATARLTTVPFFFAATSTSTNIHFAVYADSSGSPGARVGGEVVLAAPAAGAWNYVTGFSGVIVAGSVYWVAYLLPSGGGGTFAYSNNAASGGVVKDSTSAVLASLADPAPAYGGGPFANVVNVGVMGDLPSPVLKGMPLA